MRSFLSSVLIFLFQPFVSFLEICLFLSSTSRCFKFLVVKGSVPVSSTVRLSTTIFGFASWAYDSEVRNCVVQLEAVQYKTVCTALGLGSFEPNYVHVLFLLPVAAPANHR